MTAPRKTLLFYCQHLVGIGHLVRSLSIAAGCAGGFRVVLACGGRVPRVVPLPPGVELLRLPPVEWGEGGIVGRDGRSAAALLPRRRARLLRALAELRPDVLLVELFPFARLRMTAEVLPLLHAARNAARPPLVACSLRDILCRDDERSQILDDVSCTILNHFFDAVLVHSDPALADLGESFRPSVPLEIPLRYTGFVGEAPLPRREAPGGRTRRVLVSAGGGRVGGELMRTTLEAHAGGGFEAGVRLTLSAGPFLPDTEWRALRERAAGVRGVVLRRWTRDFRGALLGHAASVSQCGYNTAMDLLATRTPALVVPYAAPGEDEQARRARKLEARGAVLVLPAREMTPATLAEGVRRALAFTPRAQALRMDGAARTAAWLDEATDGRAAGGGWRAPAFPADPSPFPATASQEAAA